MNARKLPMAAVAAGVALMLVSTASRAVEVSVTGLVTDDPSANPARITDPGLLNAWGISMSAASPFWISSNGGGTSAVYRVNPLTQAVTKVPLTVTIPGAGNPTGQVFNTLGAGQFNGDAFLFVSEDGTVSGWRGPWGPARSRWARSRRSTRAPPTRRSAATPTCTPRTSVAARSTCSRATPVHRA